MESEDICMHLTYVFQLGKQYAVFGFVAAVLAVLLMVFCFFIYCKYFQREETKFSMDKICSWRVVYFLF